MPSAFDLALAAADAVQLRVFGESCTFHDPAGVIADADIVVVFSEKDIAEPPRNQSRFKGQWSRGWTTLVSFPEGVTNPEGYQLVTEEGDTYTIRSAPDEDGGKHGVSMLLHKSRTQAAETKTMDDVANMDNVTDMDTLAETA